MTDAGEADGSRETLLGFSLQVLHPLLSWEGEG